MGARLMTCLFAAHQSTIRAIGELGF